MFLEVQFLDLFEISQKQMFKICSYLQKMTLNLIETLKISIYNPKHTKNTKRHLYFFYQHFRNPYFPKLEVKIANNEQTPKVS